MQDTIERSITIPADIEAVWTALTSAEGIRQWFGDVAEIDLRPGGEATFGWTDYDSSSHAIVERVDRPRFFSYRWAASGGKRVDAGPSTLVEFSLVVAGDETTVSVRESGFASLPSEIRAKNLEDNTSGWKSEMQDLYDYVTTSSHSG
jgi:uncharacterized protein YndB with AHSA1/START domain